MRRQFERDRKAANRALASEGIRQPARFQDDFNAALQGPLKLRPHDEVVAGLLEAEEDILRLEHMLAQRDAEIARLREEAATLRERERIQ
jgi:hypothetical protein